MWFEQLTGFAESSPEQVYKNLSCDGSILKSKVNNKQYDIGSLKTPSLADLRDQVKNAIPRQGKTSIREVIANVQQLHQEAANAGALFQVASQFNLLEMVSPDITPEQGVNRYEYDLTQGPACAISAGAGTIYRNYFVEVNGRQGQTADNQIDCLADIGMALGNRDNCLWEMKNGYVLASKIGLMTINTHLESCSETDLDALRGLLRVGIQSDTEVTIAQSKHKVTQLYCSALPVAYSYDSPALWERFATLILEASYEAVICAGILNAIRTGNKTVYLTLLGGGAFGNDEAWIIHAIKRAVENYRQADLDLVMVSYPSSHRERLAAFYAHDLL